LLESIGSVGLEYFFVSVLTGSVGGSEDWELEAAFSVKV
jgi:hypothetical protein